MCLEPSRHEQGFTLIELLIVVAVIAILAAIAVPNFMEAQTRAKVSRAHADMRSLATAVEAYAVDNNNYPVLYRTEARPNFYAKYNYYLWWTNPDADYPGFGWLTSPISYISEYPEQAFAPRLLINQGHAGQLHASYWFLNFKGAAGDLAFQEENSLDELTGNYALVNPMPINIVGGGHVGIQKHCEWVMFGIGPSGVLDLDNPNTGGANQYNVSTCAVQLTFAAPTYKYLAQWRAGHWKAYDPTNGTLSLGFIYRLP